jgi:thiol:disulfide interchange protein DsbG
VKAGKVQLNTLLVAFLNPNSGRNASAILNAKDPVSAWESTSFLAGKHCLNLRAEPHVRTWLCYSSTNS